VPAVAACTDCVEIVGTGFTVIWSVADFVVSLIDVAMTVAVMEVVTETGVL
jgi:hypothetical protein